MLGDVCGSGPEAASQTALTRHTVRAAAMFDADPATVMHTLNRALLRSNTNRFTTAMFVRLEPSPARGDRRHRRQRRAPARADPARRRLLRGDAAAGQLLGVTEFAIEDLQVAEHRLRPGDTLVLYTDGLTEARRSGVLFGVEGVKATLSRRRGATPTELANALVAAALEHADAPLSDDVAIVVLRVADRLSRCPAERQHAHVVIVVVALLLQGVGQRLRPRVRRDRGQQALQAGVDALAAPFDQPVGVEHSRSPGASASVASVRGSAGWRTPSGVERPPMNSCAWSPADEHRREVTGGRQRRPRP